MINEQVIVIYKIYRLTFKMQSSLSVATATNHSFSQQKQSTSKKRSPIDLPVQYIEPAMRRDTPQLDHPEHTDTALTTMRRLEDPNKVCTHFAVVESTTSSTKKAIQYSDPVRGYHNNTREHRRQRLSENVDPSERVDTVSSNREEIVSANKAGQTPLTFLYSSVKHALKDNINTLDFSRRLQEPLKKQQMRYQVNTHDSEQSMILDNDGTHSCYDRRPSTQTDKPTPSLDPAHQDEHFSSQASFKRPQQQSNDKEAIEPTVKKSISKRQLMLHEETSPIDLIQQTAVRQSGRFYHTFSNEQQTTLGTSMRHRDSMQSNRSKQQRSSHKALPSAIDPSTPMFCSQIPSNAMYQSMQIPKSSQREGEQDLEDQKNEEVTQDPQIISRTIGLMQLNSSSSCQSLDNMRDQVFNLTIKRPNVIEADDSREEINPQIDVRTETIYIKSKKQSNLKTPQSAGSLSGQLSRTQKLYLGNCQSQQQSRYLQAASRVLSPLSQNSSIKPKISASTTPTGQKKSTAKKRPKSTGSTNTANSSIFRAQQPSQQMALTTLKSRSSAVSFSGLSNGNNFVSQQQQTLSYKAPKKLSVNSKTRKPTHQVPSTKSRQPSQLSLNHSSFAKSNQSRCPSQLSISNTALKACVTRTFSPTYFNNSSSIIKTGKSSMVGGPTFGRPQSSSSISSILKKKGISQCSNGSVVVIKKKSTKSLVKQTFNSLPSQQTVGTNITLRNQASRSTIVSFSGKQVKGAREVSPVQQVMGKCNIIRKGLQQRGQVINDKNEVVTRLIEEKKQAAQHIAMLKKEIIQNQKQVKTIKDNNKQSQDDIVRLAELVNQKADRNNQLQREIALVKKDVRSLQQDCEDLKQDKSKLMLKIESEYQLVDVVQRLIVNLKKQINEVRREKEKLFIAVRGEQRKTMEVINKRRTLITEESEKIYMDFKDTIGAPCIGSGAVGHHNLSLNTSQVNLLGHTGYSSRSQLHTPKGLANKEGQVNGK